MGIHQPSHIHRYKVLQRLGRGGMGIVYLAHDPIIGRDVAIKVLRSLDEPNLFERFQREIRIAGALSHPSIVRIYDAGEIDEQPFVAMEYVAGRTLETLIKQAAPLDLDKKLSLLIDLALGLSYAHTSKVVHRDIKPSNLIVDESDRLKILDFGVARFAGKGFTSHVAVGTPGYMSPEQLHGHSADTRSDIFAAGVVAYEFIAYRRPFAGAEVANVYHRILHEQPPPLREVAPGIPASLERLVAHCLEKDRDRRLDDAVALAIGLREIRESLTKEETTVTALPAPRFEARGESGPVPSTPKRIASSTAQRVADLRRRALQETMDRARDAQRRGDYAEAIDAAEHALVIDSHDAEAASLLEQARAALERRAVAPPPAVAPRATDDQDPPTMPTLRRQGGFAPALAPRPADVDPTPVAPPVPAPAVAAAIADPAVTIGAPQTASTAGDRAVWGRSVQADTGASGHPVAWAISASVHTGLAIAIVLIVLGSYTVVEPKEPSLGVVIPVELTPPPPLVQAPLTPQPTITRQPSPQPRLAAPPQTSPTLEQAPQPSPPQATAAAVPVEAPPTINPELSTQMTTVNAIAAPAAPPGPPGTIDERPVTDADQMPVIITIVKAKVPVGASGVVRVEVTIASDGRVTRVRLLDETPYHQAIVAAAEQCKFRPARRRGRPVAVNQILHFDLATDR